MYKRDIRPGEGKIRQKIINLLLSKNLMSLSKKKHRSTCPNIEGKNNNYLTVMHRFLFNFKDKTTRFEVVFFIVNLLIFSILTDIEYNLYERHNAALFIEDVPKRLISAFTWIIPFGLCYKVIIQGYLVRKKYFQFVLSFIVFLVIMNFYLIGCYWLISKLTFLPLKITHHAYSYFKADVVMHFSVIYMLKELLVITALAYFLKSAGQEKQVYELRQYQLQAELNYLKVQLEPHFFFNTLNNIYSLALQQSPLTAPLIAKHAEMMRYILNSSSSTKVRLQQEVEFLKNYVEVEKVRYSENIDIRFETQGINSSALIEPLLLLPFIENSFKHGIREEIKEGYVQIVIYLVNNALTFQISNSKALDTDPKTFKHGVGLENVSKRLDILYQEEYDLEVKDNKSDYEVRLSLTLK